MAAPGMWHVRPNPDARMTANGLASCAQGTMAHHPDLVREAFGLGDEVKVLFWS
ncbi:MAG: hypothetical protein CM15mP120_00510 [Pseudomonadota bacterium]|nr:MAG: hypothetical protein CM15mP120_00510 [Pseudomonadota bacterium]